MSETKAELVARLDKAAGELVGAYRQLGYMAEVVRSEGETMRLIATLDASSIQAKLLYHAADAMADRAFALETAPSKH